MIADSLWKTDAELSQKPSDTHKRFREKPLSVEDRHRRFKKLNRPCQTYYHKYFKRTGVSILKYIIFIFIDFYFITTFKICHLSCVTK